MLRCDKFTHLTLIWNVSKIQMLIVKRLMSYRESDTRFQAIRLVGFHINRIIL